MNMMRIAASVRADAVVCSGEIAVREFTMDKVEQMGDQLPEP